MRNFVICINNKCNPASLIVGKVYITLLDSEAMNHDMVRVLDEDKSDPDGYLYPSAMFASMNLPKAAEHALIAADDRTS